MTNTADDGTDGLQLPESTRIGRVTLRVGSLDSMVQFYEETIGLAVQRREDGRASLGASADGPTLLSLREDADAPARPREAAGLFHVAFLHPTRASLADSLNRVREAGSALTGASDHLVSEALYLRDPEGNGIELYRDRPRSEWEYDGEEVRMDTLPLDLEDLAAASDATSTDAIDPDATVGHVHLEVSDVDRSTAFYRDELGFGVRSRWNGARFLAAGGYHHHLGLNTWNGRSAPVGDHRGLDGFEVVVPDEEALSALRSRMEDAEPSDSGFRVADPDGIDVEVGTE